MQVIFIGTISALQCLKVCNKRTYSDALDRNFTGPSPKVTFWSTAMFRFQGSLNVFILQCFQCNTQSSSITELKHLFQVILVIELLKSINLYKVWSTVIIFPLIIFPLVIFLKVVWIIILFWNVENLWRYCKTKVYKNLGPSFIYWLILIMKLFLFFYINLTNDQQNTKKVNIII